MVFSNNDSKLYSFGRIIGLFSGFFIFLSIAYLIFLRNYLSYPYILLLTFLLGGTFLFLNRTIIHGKFETIFKGFNEGSGF